MIKQEKLTCPKCSSEDMIFSKNKLLNVCADCHNEFTIKK